MTTLMCAGPFAATQFDSDLYINQYIYPIQIVAYPHGCPEVSNSLSALDLTNCYLCTIMIPLVKANNPMANYISEKSFNTKNQKLHAQNNSGLFILNSLTFRQFLRREGTPRPTRGSSQLRIHLPPVACNQEGRLSGAAYSKISYHKNKVKVSK